MQRAGGVVGDVRVRATAAALIEQDDAVGVGIEELAVERGAAAAGPAVQEHGGLAVGVAADLPEDAVAVADVEETVLGRLDRGIELAH